MILGRLIDVTSVLRQDESLGSLKLQHMVVSQNRGTPM